MGKFTFTFTQLNEFSESLRLFSWMGGWRG